MLRHRLSLKFGSGFCRQRTATRTAALVRTNAWWSSWPSPPLPSLSHRAKTARGRTMVEWAGSKAAFVRLTLLLLPCSRILLRRLLLLLFLLTRLLLLLLFLPLLQYRRGGHCVLRLLVQKSHTAKGERRRRQQRRVQRPRKGEPPDALHATAHAQSARAATAPHQPARARLI